MQLSVSIVDSTQIIFKKSRKLLHCRPKTSILLMLYIFRGLKTNSTPRFQLTAKWNVKWYLHQAFVSSHRCLADQIHCQTPQLVFQLVSLVVPCWNSRDTQQEDWWERAELLQFQWPPCLTLSPAVVIPSSALDEPPFQTERESPPNRQRVGPWWQWRVGWLAWKESRGYLPVPSSCMHHPHSPQGLISLIEVISS